MPTPSSSSATTPASRRSSRCSPRAPPIRAAACRRARSPGWPCPPVRSNRARRACAISGGRDLRAMGGARALLLACGLFGAAGPALAGDPAPDGIIRLDASRSDVGFRVKVMWLLGVRGHFGKVDGTVRLDPFRNELRVDARIDVASVHMGSSSYEEWVKSPEFFDVAAHPQIEFTSDAFPRARLRAGGELPGELTVRGVRQPVQFDLQPAECERPAYDCPIR